ncbi:hypothetical protein K438DRAFT_1777862 [Mycena galopus ATCC 62051]|nr:hypothetical protein K438DRAFT_1777862 [Mycena galopus ATCC 62051]
MFRPGLGLKAAGLAWLWGLGLFKISGRATPTKPGLASAWLRPRPGLLVKFVFRVLCGRGTQSRPKKNCGLVSQNHDFGHTKAAAFRLGLGLEECQAEPKAGSSPNVGSAWARLAEPKSRGFAASGPGRNITIQAVFRNI